MSYVVYKISMSNNLKYVLGDNGFEDWTEESLDYSKQVRTDFSGKGFKKGTFTLGAWRKKKKDPEPLPLDSALRKVTKPKVSDD